MTSTTAVSASSFLVFKKHFKTYLFDQSTQLYRVLVVFAYDMLNWLCLLLQCITIVAVVEDMMH